MPSTNMNTLMRNRRKDLSSYMYGGDGSSSSSASDTGSSSPAASTSDSPDNLQVKQPGDPEAGADSFVYEPFTDSPGAWVVYPPGVPCDTEQQRVVMDHPADSGEFDKMQQALDAAGPSASDTTASADTGSPADTTIGAGA